MVSPGCFLPVREDHEVAGQTPTHTFQNLIINKHRYNDAITNGLATDTEKIRLFGKWVSLG
jgi:hypothetical protein